RAVVDHQHSHPCPGTHRTGRAAGVGRPAGADGHPRGRVPRADGEGVPGMTVAKEDTQTTDGQATATAPPASHSFRALSRAAFKGFIRDKATLFWTILFPLMFLVIFGLLFNDGGGDPTAPRGGGPRRARRAPPDSRPVD